MPDTKCLEASPFVPTGCFNAIEQRLGMAGQCQVQKTGYNSEMSKQNFTVE